MALSVWRLSPGGNTLRLYCIAPNLSEDAITNLRSPVLGSSLKRNRISLAATPLSAPGLPTLSTVGHPKIEDVGEEQHLPDTLAHSVQT